MERGLEIERDGDREIERWRKRSREMGESSASMGEEVTTAGFYGVKRRSRRQTQQLDASTSVNQTNKIFKKIAAAADAGSCGNQTNSTTVLDLSKNKLLRRNPNFFRQSQEPEAFEPLTKRHLWIDPTQFWRSQEARDLRRFVQQPLGQNPANVVQAQRAGCFGFEQQQAFR